MPGEFESYVEKFSAAKAAWNTLYMALQSLVNTVNQVHQSPQVLAQPSFSTWLTHEELREMFAEAQQKLIPLQGDYNALPEDIKKYAPQPHTASQRGY